jgi:hypothetical protein
VGISVWRDTDKFSPLNSLSAIGFTCTARLALLSP